MLIRCPTCASGYDLDPGMLGEGRVLRCAHCRDAWAYRAGPEIVAEASASRCDAPGAAPAPKPRARRPAPPPLRLSAGAAAAALLAALLGASLAAVAGKAPIVAAYPPSEAVFAMLGLPVNLSGLALGDVRSTVESGDGPAVLTLQARITNLRSAPTEVPPLRIAVRDTSRRELYYWTAPAPKARLAAGETVLFRSRLTAPPRDGQDLAVSFADPPPERRRLAEAMPGDR